MESTLPSIFKYLDFRDYLRDYRTARKENDPGFTNTYICYRLGQINSRGYFNNVIAGRTSVGPALRDRFVELLELKGKEAEYFRALVSYTQSSEPAEREAGLALLLKNSRPDGRKLTAQQASYYADWRHALVRALLDIVDFDGTDWQLLIGKTTAPLTQREVKKSIALLSELGLIRKNRAGYFKATESSISCSDEIGRHLVRQYQSTLMHLSAEAVLRDDCSPQKVTSMTVSLSKDAYDTIVKKVDRLREEIRIAVQQSSSQSDRLYQINLHLFPQTKSS